MMNNSNSKISIIAEIANSHQGDPKTALDLIDAVSKSGTKIIKFQIFRSDELLERNHEKYDLFKKLEFSPKEWSKIFQFARKKNLKIFADVFGLNSAKFAVSQKLDAFKIHSSDITNPVLLEFFSKLHFPILLSTAGCYPNEIDEAIKILKKENKEIILMHGFQGYPTKLDDQNLSRIISLKKQFNLPIGLMDHLSGNSPMATIIPLLGIGLGVNVIEKHITLNRNKKEIDYFSSLNPDEFKEFVRLVRNSEIAMGSKTFTLFKNEKTYRLAHKKNSVAKKQIKKNQQLKINSFEYKRTKKKSDSLSYFDFLKNTNSKQIKKGEILQRSSLSKKKKIAAVVACRVDSDRLFGKPMQLINTFPILHLLIKQLKTSKLIDDVVLAVSEKHGNEIFLEFARKNNLKAITGDDDDVLQRLIDGANYVNADVVFRVTSENPFIYWEFIDTVIDQHVNGNYDFSYVEEIPIGSGFELIDFNALKKSHIQGKKKHRSELCSLYIHEHQKSFKIKSIKPPKALQYPKIRLTVDTLEDLMLARIIHKSVGNKDIPIPLSKILKFLAKNPSLTKINSDIPLGVTRIWP